ncbi:hypothetical protein lerEdw1_011262 [Lerista edwardsae]|nr:hypothetical protein lerEdw1_011262 [Lerista edwardsae]
MAAAAPAQPCNRFFDLHLLLPFIALWCALLGSGSTETVTQQPTFVRISQQSNHTFSCSVDGSNFNVFWFRQLPGQTELQALGSLYFSDSELKEILPKPNSENWLSGKWVQSGKSMTLELKNLQPDDTGLYLCGARAQCYRQEVGLVQNRVPTRLEDHDLPFRSSTDAACT